jgi:hypothetical protein
MFSPPLALTLLPLARCHHMTPPSTLAADAAIRR